MKKSAFSQAVLACSLVVAPLLGVACSSDAGVAQDNAKSGSFQMPLITVTNGHRYRLKDAMVSISGPTYVYLQSTDDPAETALSATLAAGNYYAFLQQWTLERDDGTGTFAPVRATLTSNSQVNFSIFDASTTTISYAFETDGTVVIVGSGDLKVTVSVNEVPPVCTPLGTDCAAGTWCPPTGLTGVPLACIAAGTSALGVSCNAPAECVRNASCVDIGSGPVCTALCSTADVGTVCASGGTCRDTGAGYGICRP